METPPPGQRRDLTRAPGSWRSSSSSAPWGRWTRRVLYVKVTAALKGAEQFPPHVTVMLTFPATFDSG